MQSVKEQLLLTKADYDTIMAYLKNGMTVATFNRHDAEELEMELKKAKVVGKEELPVDVVQLNSVVTIRDEKTTRVMIIKLVTPDKANIRERKISVLSPVGTALIGYRQGAKVSWQVPAGTKIFTILEVSNAVP